MKTLRNYLVIVLLAIVMPALFMTSCKKTEENKAFETLKTYLVDNNLDLSNILDGWIMKDLALVDSVQNDADPNNDYYIIDLRSADDFATGHIKGAVNSTLAGILDAAANAGNKPILVVCYTGQVAGHGLVALRLSGYPNSQVLIWGMSGWNADFDKWTPNVGDVAVNNANWIAPPGNIAADETYDYPVINTDETDGAKILAERVNKLLSDGFKGIDATTVLENPDQYFINNYWAAADVETYGNIKGAHRINPLTIAGDEIAKLDPSKTIVTYCWTGQTSSVITAYLNVLGYNALSLKFGANAMIHSNLQAHKWSAPGNHSYVK